jgi:hypothetical protein
MALKMWLALGRVFKSSVYSTGNDGAALDADIIVLGRRVR